MQIIERDQLKLFPFSVRKIKRFFDANRLDRCSSEVQETAADVNGEVLQDCGKDAMPFYYIKAKTFTDVSSWRRKGVLE